MCRGFAGESQTEAKQRRIVAACIDHHGLIHLLSAAYGQQKYFQYTGYLGSPAKDCRHNSSDPTVVLASSECFDRSGGIPENGVLAVVRLLQGARRYEQAQFDAGRTAGQGNCNYLERESRHRGCLCCSRPWTNTHNYFHAGTYRYDPY